MKSSLIGRVCVAISVMAACQICEADALKQKNRMPVEAVKATDVWTGNYETKVTMGDGDSRVRVREIALDELKRQAASAVGAVVESVSVLKDNRLSEQTRIITVALVQLDQIRERVSVDSSGVVSLVVSARATVDSSELERRSKALREDSDKALAVSRLEKENESLRRELMQVRSKATRPGVNSDALLDQQSKLIGAIRNNEQQISQVFEAGVLLAMADKEEQRVKKIFDLIDRSVFTPMLETKAEAKVVSTSRSGDKINVGVSVGWNIELGKIKSALSPYVKVRTGGEGGSNYLAITTPDNAEGKETNEVSRRVLNYLAQNKVNLIVSLAGESYKIPVVKGVLPDFFREERCDLPAEVGRDGVADVCIYKTSTSSKHFSSGSDEATRVNPITIKIPVSMATGPVSVSTSWEWIDSKGETRSTNPIVSSRDKQ